MSGTSEERRGASEFTLPIQLDELQLSHDTPSFQQSVADFGHHRPGRDQRLVKAAEDPDSERLSLILGVSQSHPKSGIGDDQFLSDQSKSSL
ncbi:hypothetical protein [Lamprobacter modestohalophilus]|uniref:hypothetical protein n=1 Tax=Lamprobacter modestohalophilus TaxID=1064514 RepID=UPI0019086726|nr:hypothetical protein [Lamprobacter modestohalophilus]